MPRADNKKQTARREWSGRGRGCSNDNGGDVVARTAGGGGCDKSDGGAADDATIAGGDNDGN